MYVCVCVAVTSKCWLHATKCIYVLATCNSADFCVSALSKFYIFGLLARIGIS